MGVVVQFHIVSCYARYTDDVPLVAVCAHLRANRVSWSISQSVGDSEEVAMCDVLLFVQELCV